jgi:hypothetical protein
LDKLCTEFDWQPSVFISVSEGEKAPEGPRIGPIPC